MRQTLIARALAEVLALASVTPCGNTGTGGGAGGTGTGGGAGTGGGGTGGGTTAGLRGNQRGLPFVVHVIHAIVEAQSP